MNNSEQLIPNVSIISGPVVSSVVINQNPTVSLVYPTLNYLTLFFNEYVNLSDETVQQII